MRGNIGGGSFVAGLKRIISPHSSIEFHTMMGVCPFPASGLSPCTRGQHTSCGHVSNASSWFWHACVLVACSS